MTEISQERRAKVIAALAHYDDLSRDDRAGRVLWLSQHDMSPAIVMGRMEPMTLKQEASEAYVNGHFIACLLLAMAYIEHAVADELIDANLATPGVQFVEALQLAKSNGLLPDELVERAEALRLRRNPYAHRKPEGHEHSLATRFKREKLHPKSILESDAKEALEVMYGVFQATLRVGQML